MSLNRDAIPVIMPLRARKVLDRPAGPPLPNRALAKGSWLSSGGSGDMSELLSPLRNDGGVESFSVRFGCFELSASFISTSWSFRFFFRNLRPPAGCDGGDTSEEAPDGDDPFSLTGIVVDFFMDREEGPREEDFDFDPGCFAFSSLCLFADLVLIKGSSSVVFS